MNAQNCPYDLFEYTNLIEYTNVFLKKKKPNRKRTLATKLIDAVVIIILLSSGLDSRQEPDYHTQWLSQKPNRSKQKVGQKMKSKHLQGH